MAPASLHPRATGLTSRDNGAVAGLPGLDAMVAAFNPPCQSFAMHVTIIARPSGEAPEWVRDAWIGLELPLAYRRSRNWRGIGVLTGPRGFLRQVWGLIRGRTIRMPGYLIKSKTAIEILARANPAAADWWRENAPQFLEGWNKFIFDEAACRVEES
jgi:hypothetical protein